METLHIGWMFFITGIPTQFGVGSRLLRKRKMPKAPAFLIGERICYDDGILNGLWGNIVEVGKNEIKIKCDNRNDIVSVHRSGSGKNGFELLFRHGDYIISPDKRYEDPKGIEESKRCLNEAMKVLSNGMRHSFMAGKWIARRIAEDLEKEEDRKYKHRQQTLKAYDFLKAHISELPENIREEAQKIINV